MEFYPCFAEVEGGVAVGSLPLERGGSVRFAFRVGWIERFGAVEVGGGQFKTYAYQIIGVVPFGVFVFEKIIH